MGMPVHPAHPPYIFSLKRRHGDRVRGDGFSACNEVLVLSGHTGTHIDGLAHASLSGKLHGGLLVHENMGEFGIKTVGMEAVPPLVCRGILLDVARHKGVDVLGEAEPVTSLDLDQCARAEGVVVRPGDAVMVRTGWMRYWDDPPRYVGVQGGVPGVDCRAGEWLAERRVRLAGSDTVAFEQIRPGDAGMSVHATLLVHAGIHIMEALNLEELARDRVYTFLCIVSPLKIVGATGSPVRPLAIPVAGDGGPPGPTRPGRVNEQQRPRHSTFTHVGEECSGRL